MSEKNGNIAEKIKTFRVCLVAAGSPWATNPTAIRIALPPTNSLGVIYYAERWNYKWKGKGEKISQEEIRVELSNIKLERKMRRQERRRGRDDRYN